MSERKERLRLIAQNIVKETVADIGYMTVYEMTEGDDLVDDEVSEVLEIIRGAKVEIPNG